MNQLFRNSVIVSGCLGLMAGCASSPKVDTTPKNPTSVVNVSYYINGGFAPDISGTQAVYTRPKQRRIDNVAEFDNLLMRWANSDTSDIFRIDRNLLWVLDNDARTYQECDLSGCVEVPLFPSDVSDEEDSEEYESYEDRQCEVTLALNEFNVEATGDHRQLGGLVADEYVVSWQTDMEDRQGRTDTNLLKFVFWTVPPTQSMSKAWRVHTEATDNYLDAVGEKNVLVRLLGRQGFKTISAFTGDIEKTDEQAFGNWVDELARIKGYPISIKMEWFQRNETCPEAKKRHSTDIDVSKGLDGLKDAASGFLGNLVDDQKDELLAEWQKKPRIRYVYEVESISEKLVHDSIFQVPEDYTLSDRQ